MKPDDIPQDVWNRAEADASEYVEWLIPAPEEYEQSEFVLSQVIARAILAAEQRGAERERERCARIADEMREKYGSPTGDAYDNGLWDQGVRIATAIRNSTALSHEEPTP